MAFSGAKLVALCCFFVHFVISADSLLIHAEMPEVTAFVLIVQGATILCYPLLGLLADTCFNRYKFIKLSTVFFLISSLLLLALELVACILSQARISVLTVVPWYLRALIALSIVGVCLSVGMFRATAIQFGMDQMVEASTDQISTFILWYYWSMNIGIGIQAIITQAALLVLGACIIPADIISNRVLLEINAFLYPLLPIVIVQTLAAIVPLVIFIRFKKRFTIEPLARRNQFTLVYKVLKYVWKHKYPERRSAFTYWEEDIPSRIDLGKCKYGGPFTTEQVEDVKTFIFLFVLIISLFGFCLVDDGYSVIRQLNYKLCPSKLVNAVVSGSPNILNSVAAMVLVPFYHFLVLPRLYRYVPNMLHRLGIGSTLMLFQELAGMVIVFSSWQKYYRCSPISAKKNFFLVAPIGDCFVSNWYVSINRTCIKPDIHSYCGQADDLFFWLLIPIITRTLAYHLVFMTALEFVSAQSPLTTKGLLISIWYALSSQRYLIQAAAAVYIDKEEVWLIFQGVKVSLMLLSLLVYCCVAKRYHYRLRDEVVNERFLVEEVYDRELRQAHEYQQKKRKEMQSIYGCSVKIAKSYGTTHETIQRDEDTSNDCIYDHY